MGLRVQPRHADVYGRKAKAVLSGRLPVDDVRISASLMHTAVGVALTVAGVLAIAGLTIARFAAMILAAKPHE